MSALSRARYDSQRLPTTLPHEKQRTGMICPIMPHARKQFGQREARANGGDERRPGKVRSRQRDREEARRGMSMSKGSCTVPSEGEEPKWI